MFTQEEYYWAWTFYLTGAALCMLFAWVVSAKFSWAWVRLVSRAAVAVFLVMPWTTTEGGQYLTPAWVVSAFETLLEGPQAFWRAGMPLVVAMMSAIFLSLMSWVAISLVIKKRRSSAASA